VTDADAIDVQRLGDDHEVGLSLRHAAALCQVRNAGEAAALFVHGAADLDGAGQRNAGTLDGLGGKERRRDARFHVARATAVDPSVADHAAERIDSPPVARGNDVEMTVEMNHRAGSAAPDADDVHARMPRRVLAQSFGGDAHPKPRRFKSSPMKRAWSYSSPGGLRSGCDQIGGVARSRPPRDRPRRGLGQWAAWVVSRSTIAQP
jgi:hypothetical protein